MDFSYKKNDNQTLFKSLEENPDFGIQKPQNYIFHYPQRIVMQFN